MKILPGSASRALHKVKLIILAHLRRNARDVISPACQNGAHNPVRANIICHRHKDSPEKISFATSLVCGSCGQRGLLFLGCTPEQNDSGNFPSALPRRGSPGMAIVVPNSLAAYTCPCLTIVTRSSQKLIEESGSCCAASNSRFASRLARPFRARSAVTRASSGRLLLSDRCARITYAACPS